MKPSPDPVNLLKGRATQPIYFHKLLTVYAVLNAPQYSFYGDGTGVTVEKVYWTLAGEGFVGLNQPFPASEMVANRFFGAHKKPR